MRWKREERKEPVKDNTTPRDPKLKLGKTDLSIIKLLIFLIFYSYKQIV